MIDKMKTKKKAKKISELRKKEKMEVKGQKAICSSEWLE